MDSVGNIYRKDYRLQKWVERIHWRFYLTPFIKPVCYTVYSIQLPFIKPVCYTVSSIQLPFIKPAYCTVYSVQLSFIKSVYCTVSIIQYPVTLH